MKNCNLLDNKVDKLLTDILNHLKTLGPESLLTIKEIEFYIIIIKSSEIGRIYAREKPKTISIPQLYLEIPNFAINKVFMKMKTRLTKEGYEIRDSGENAFVVKI